MRRWWASDGEPTTDSVEARYAPCIDGLTPTRMWVVEVNGRSVGFVQDYRIGDYPEYAVLGPDPDAIGVDYLIGDPAWVGRGLGARMLWAWMLRARHRLPDATDATSPPPTTATPRRCGSWPRRGSPRGCGSTSPRTTARVDTVVGCTLDVRRVLG